VEILIVPVIGAIIGLFTNWLAIKMLFLPRKEYRLWGYRLPFTPGVLPKSQERVAKNLGHAVGDYLLTDETLTEAIKNTGVDEELFNLLDSLFESLKSNESRLGEIAKKICADDYEGLTASMKQAIMAHYMNYINDDGNLDKLKDFVFSSICKFLMEIKAVDTGGKSISAINLYIQENGISFMNSYEVEVFIDGLVKMALKWIYDNEKDMKTLVSDENTQKVRDFVTLGVPVVFDYLKNILVTNEEIDNGLSELTRKVVEDSVGQLIGSMVHRKVYASIKESAFDFLSSDKGRERTVEIVNGKIDEFLLRKPAEFMELVNIGDELKQSITMKAVGRILDNYKAVAEYIFSGALKIMDKAPDMSIYELANKFLPDFEPALKYRIDKIVDEALENYAVAIFEAFYSAVSDKVANIRLSQIFSSSGEKIYFNLVKLLQSKKDLLIEKAAALIISKLDISKTVEDKINELGVLQMENIVLEVARKELDYITYMGGLLGFVMGFIPEVINRLAL